MYRFNLPYYMYDRGYRHLPYNYFRGYFYSPYNNYFQSNIANINQSIYNNGYMFDVFQDSNIMQSGSSHIVPQESNSGICTNLGEEEQSAQPEQLEQSQT